jgi:glutathione S-transferase
MLTVHHLRQSQSDRIIWLCEELGIPYELKTYVREPSMAAPPDFKALSPFGTAPVITDEGLVLGESAAIVEYVCMRHGGGRLVVGPDDPTYADYLFWFHFANGSLVPAMMVDFVTAASGAPALGTGPSRSERALAMCESRLGEAPYFAGESFSAADIMMCLPWSYARQDLAGFPNVSDYITRIAARPAWQRTVALH